jgi:hypothetical protein
MRWLRAAAVSVLLIPLTPAPLGAQPAGEANLDPAREQARELGYAGVRAYVGGDYAAASDKLERSFALLPVPSLGLWSARALVKLGKLVEAKRRYEAVLQLPLAADAPEAQRSAKATSAIEHGELLPRIPSVRVGVAGAPPEAVSVTLDGAPLPRERWDAAEPIDPGPHELAGTHGNSQQKVQFTASEGRGEEFVLRFAEQAPAAAALGAPPEATTAVPAMPADSAADTRAFWRTSGWVALGAGAAALAVSGVSYGIGRGKYDDVKAGEEDCPEPCDPLKQARIDDDIQTYNGLRTLQFATLAAGGVLAAAGVTILLVDPGAPSGESATARVLRLRLGAGTASVGGSF